MSELCRKIVYLNGPPGCGKDEIANTMSYHYQFIHLKFADVIKDCACAALSITREQLEKLKDTVHPVLGTTVRAFLISLSEDYFKPKFGEQVFGFFLLEKIKTYGSQRIIFSDSGFYPEFRPVAFANYSGTNLVLAIHRPGYDYSKDSRSYWWEANKLDAQRFARYGVIHNDTTLRQLRAKASRKICKELEIEWVEQWTPLD